VRKKKQLLLGMVLALATVSVLLYVAHYAKPTATPDALAKEVMSLCKTAPVKQVCYGREIPLLMDRGLSMEEAFKVTRIALETDPDFNFCHLLSHTLAEKEVAKDPLLWKEVAARSPNMCSNGGIHGAFLARFKTESMASSSNESIFSQLEGICESPEEKKLDGLSQASCYHSLGHLLMYLTLGDVDRSMTVCDLLVDASMGESNRIMCYDGSHMQLHEPFEPEDFALIAGKEITTPEELYDLCSQYVDAKRQVCFSWAWVLYQDELYNPSTSRIICEPLREYGDEYDFCLTYVFNMALILVSNYDVYKINTYCSEVPLDIRGNCYANAASRFMTTDRAFIDRSFKLCGLADSVENENICYERMRGYASFVFVPDSQEHTLFCQRLAEESGTGC